jgi:hypothetical protein
VPVLSHSFSSLRRGPAQLIAAGQLPLLLIPFVVWIVCAVECAQRSLGFIPAPYFWFVVSVTITIYSGLRIFRLHARAKLSAQKSAGSAQVAEVLQRIRSKGFVVFHDLPGSSRKIDHVVVGPSGIYAIETKARSGSGTIDYLTDEELIFAGRIKDGRPLRYARGGAAAVQKRLHHELEDSYPVKPLVVFVGDWNVRAHKKNLTVHVTTLDKLVQYFDEQPPELTGKEIDLIASHLQGGAAA